MRLAHIEALECNLIGCMHKHVVLAPLHMPAHTTPVEHLACLCGPVECRVRRSLSFLCQEAFLEKSVHAWALSVSNPTQVSDVT